MLAFCLSMPVNPARFRVAASVCVLATTVLVACASGPESGENTGISSAALDAYCTATVNGVGDLDVETDYLAHVVHCENGGAPLESLKAQAVAARSFLYYKLAKSGSINDGTGDQVYTCASGPDADDMEAVKETSGIVLQYKSTQVCAFFVAGGNASPPSCEGTGSDPTNTEKYVTYNAGLSGPDIHQSTIGFVDPSNYANRGCMSQLGSRCLADQGNSFDAILKFYYGDDIDFVQATGTCITEALPDGGTIFGPDGSISGSTGSIVPTRSGDASPTVSSNDGSTLNESGGCAAAPTRNRAENKVFGALFAALMLAARRRRSVRAKRRAA